MNTSASSEASSTGRTGHWKIAVQIKHGSLRRYTANNYVFMGDFLRINSPDGQIDYVALDTIATMQAVWMPDRIEVQDDTPKPSALQKPFHGGCQACGPGRLWVGDSKQEVLNLLAIHMKSHMIVWENNG